MEIPLVGMRWAGTDAFMNGEIQMPKQYRLNVSKINKSILWTPQKTGSVFNTQVFNFFDFYTDLIQYDLGLNDETIDFLYHGHSCYLFEGHQDYSLICSTRNPYSRLVSLFQHTKDYGQKEYQEGFKEFINKLFPFEGTPYFHRGYHFKERVPDYFIRVESLFEDYGKIPFIKNSEFYKSGFLEHICSKKRNENLKITKNWREYYTDETADIIYSSYQDYFNLLKYDRYSYKL